MSGVAKKLRYVKNVREEFQTLCTNAEKGEDSTIRRHVETRWGSACGTFEDSIFFKEEHRRLVVTPDLGISAWALSASQWKMAEHLTPILKVHLSAADRRIL